jgi:hypothetical protein
MSWFGGAFQGELVDFYYQDALDILYIDLHTYPDGWASWTSGTIKWPLSNARLISVKGNITMATTGTYAGAYGYYTSAFDFFAFNYNSTQAAINDGTNTGTLGAAWNSYRVAQNPKMMIERHRNNVLLERYTTDGSALVRGEENGDVNSNVAFGYTPPMATPNQVDEGDQFRVYWFPQTFTLPADIDE